MLFVSEHLNGMTININVVFPLYIVSKPYRLSLRNLTKKMRFYCKFYLFNLSFLKFHYFFLSF